MASTTETLTVAKPPARRTKLVCFSYAAYAKNLIHHLKSLNIPILPGLNDAEFTDIESTFNLTFPPDLRSILREGLPVGPAFPNWRSSSRQHLHVIVNLPVLSLSKNVSLNDFWSVSWGQKRHYGRDALASVKKLIDKAPVLVPIYRNCYVPSTPNMAGNPVFYIDAEEVRVLSFDLAGFFGGAAVFESMALDMPAWAAREARRIEFWTDAAERGRRTVSRGYTRGWWSGGGVDVEVGCCLDDVFWRLRDGGWSEEEVREMMTMIMMDGCDYPSGVQQLMGDHIRGVGCHVRFLSRVLLRAGWSKEDVMYSLNLQDHEIFNGGDSISKKILLKSGDDHDHHSSKVQN